MRGPRIICTAALALLAGCSAQEGQPLDAASLPAAVPQAQVAPFDMKSAVIAATVACIASETQGPSALESLRSQGFTTVKDGRAVAYMKQAPRTGIFAPDAIMVSDQNTHLACKIKVPRRDGYAYLSQVAGTLRAQSFAKVAGRGSADRYAKGDVRLMLSGTSSTYSFFSTIKLERVTAKTDGTCRDNSLPPSARQGC